MKADVQKSIRRWLPNPGPPGTLRWQLFVITALLLLMSLLALSVGIVNFVYRTETLAWRGRQGEAARSAASQVADFIKRTENVLTIVGLVDHHYLHDTPSFLQDLLAQNTGLLEIVHLDEAGLVIADASVGNPLLASLSSIPQSQWFQSARDGMHYQSPFQIANDDDPYMIISLPAPGTAVVAARLNMDVLRQVVSNIQFGQNGKAYVVNQYGQVLAHTNAEMALNLTDISDRPEYREIMSAPGKQWYGEYIDLSGNKVVGASAAVSGTDWIVITELPIREAFANTLRVILLLAIGLLLLMALMMYLNGRALDRLVLWPMEQLRSGAERIGQGELAAAIQLNTRNEITQVADAFNTMAEHLRLRQDELEAQAEALRQSQARYRAIVEDQTELICRYLPEGTLTYVNEAYCRYFNKSRGELINHSFMPLIPAEDHAHVAANIAKLSPQNPVVTYEHRVILPDGSLRWQMWTDRALYDDAGLAVEFQAVGSDITDRKMAETELRRLSAELEARVVQRTTELTLVNDSLISEVTERRRAEAELRVQQRSLTLLNDITRAALLEVSLADMAEALADRLAQMVGADACTLTLLDANGRSNRLAAASNGREFNPGSLLPEKDEQDLALMVLATGAPLVVEDVAALPEIRNHIPERLPGSKPIRSLYVLPLISSGLKLGAALLVYFQPHALTPEETALGEQAAGQVALALAKAQLYEAEQQRVGQLEALYSATSAVVSTLEEKALQEQILIAARRALPAAEKGALFLVDAESGEMQLCTLVGYADEHVHTSPFITRGYTAQAVRLRQALLVADTRSDESTRYEGEIEEMRLIRSTIVAPFVLGAQVLGAISMDSTRVEAFDHSDLQLLEAFAAAATAAIHNAQLHARLQELATIDDMTGLFNRRFFFELGEREVERALRFNHPLTAIMLDIDHFKHVNDTFGHPVGDRVLEELAQRCQRELREVDLVGRYGGEEFTILLPETRWQQGCQVAERLRRAIEAAPLTDEPEPISITVSMGVAPCTERTPNLSAVLANADRALYQAKRTGRNRVCSFLEEAEEGHPS